MRQVPGRHARIEKFRLVHELERQVRVAGRGMIQGAEREMVRLVRVKADRFPEIECRHVAGPALEMDVSQRAMSPAVIGIESDRRVGIPIPNPPPSSHRRLTIVSVDLKRALLNSLPYSREVVR